MRQIFLAGLCLSIPGSALYKTGSNGPHCAVRPGCSIADLSEGVHKSIRARISLIHLPIGVGPRRSLIAQLSGRYILQSLVLKILVSVVRFRPGPPRISLTERQPMQVGVFVCGVRSPRLRSTSGSSLHDWGPKARPNHPIVLAACT